MSRTACRLSSTAIGTTLGHELVFWMVITRPLEVRDAVSDVETVNGDGDGDGDGDTYGITISSNRKSSCAVCVCR